MTRVPACRRASSSSVVRRADARCHVILVIFIATIAIMIVRSRTMGVLTSMHASLASRSERDILISKPMRRSWHDPRHAAHWRWWPPLGWRMRRRDGRHGRWRLVGRRRGRRVSRGTAPHVSFLEARAIKSSSSSLARRRNASASRPGSSSVISSLHARRGARALWPPAWASGRHGLNTRHAG